MWITFFFPRFYYCSLCFLHHFLQSNINSSIHFMFRSILMSEKVPLYSKTRECSRAPSILCPISVLKSRPTQTMSHHYALSIPKVNNESWDGSMRYLLKQTELKQIEPSTGGTTRMKNTRMKNTHKKSSLVCVLDARGSQCPEILSASNFQVPRFSRS